MDRLLKFLLSFFTTCGAAILLAAALLIGLGQLTAAQARPLQLTFSVTNTNDSGTGSLRQAMLDANAQPGMDNILISAEGTIVLASPLPVISEAVTVQGPGAGLLAVDGDEGYRVFDIASAAVTIADLTVQRGNAAAEQGGGIRSAGLLTLTHVSVLSNTAQGAGGGVYASAGLHMVGGLLRGNHSSSGGGGGLRACCTVSLSGTQVISNTAAGDGGGAYLLGEVSIDAALFEANRCLGSLCDGGGLFSFSQTTITNTQFLGNFAQDQGGGASAPGNLVITDGLFQDNQAVTGAGGGLHGQDTAALQHTQFLSNTARGNGGGMFMFGTATVVGGLFQANESTIGGGGGLLVSGDASLTGTSFLNNSADEGGGFSHDLFDASLTNSLFAGNQAASGHGAAVLLASTGRTTLVHNTLPGGSTPGAAAIEVLTGTVGITNNIITSHTIAISNTGGVVSLDFNLFSGNTADTQGAVSAGPTNLSGNPGFRDPAGLDFHLGPASAALNHGTDAGLTADFDGDPRPLDASFEIGFDEASYITGLAIAYTPDIVEAGQPVTFSASVTTGSSVAYTWNFGDGTPSASGSPVEHVFVNPGTYSVAVTAANPWGEAGETVQIDVLAPQWEMYLAMLMR